LLAPAELDHLCVVLVATRNPLNLGAAARAMSNFGFLHLRVVNPYAVAFRQARSAVGASELLSSAEEFQSVAEAVADCQLVVGTTAVGARELHHPLKRLEEGARGIRKHLGRKRGPGRVALLFGSEKVGLSNHDLSYCHWLMRIPTREQHRSMNLGQAVAVCLYEVIRDGKIKSKARSEKAGSATSAALDQITALLVEALHGSPYLKPQRRASTEEKLRRMVRRLNLSVSDGEVWLGMLRQIVWTVKANAKASR
jgi:TrmH family RNA methyltransferase